MPYPYGEGFMHTLRLRIYIVICLLAGLALLVSSCNLPLVGGEPPLTYKVGASGNEVKHPDGVKIIVPQGTLKGDAELSVGVSAEAPPALEGGTPLGKAYEISLSKGAELMTPLEVYLPLERKPGALDAQYSAMRWDGTTWTRLPGQVEGSFYRFSTEHNTLYRLFYWEAANYPIRFVNLSGTYVRVWAYSYETFHDVGKVGYTYTGYREIEGWTLGVFSVPPGMYNQWCAEWPEYTTPVWDIFGGGYWWDFIGNFHFIFSAPVLINRYSEIEANQPETAEVRFSIGGKSPGLCPEGVRTVNRNNPLREQPMPWTVLEPTRTGTVARTGTAVRTGTAARTVTPPGTATLARSSTPQRTSTPLRTSTPVRTATSTLNFANLIIASQHIDRLEPLVLTLAHHLDFVELRGPLTLNYVYYHRPNTSVPVIIDPPIKYSCKAGET